MEGSPETLHGRSRRSYAPFGAPPGGLEGFGVGGIVCIEEISDRDPVIHGVLDLGSLIKGRAH